MVLHTFLGEHELFHTVLGGTRPPILGDAGHRAYIFASETPLVSEITWIRFLKKFILAIFTHFRSESKKSPAAAEMVPHQQFVQTPGRGQAALSTLGRHQARRLCLCSAPYFPANWKCLVGYGLIFILGFNAAKWDGSQNYSLRNIQNNDLWKLLCLQNRKL